MSSEFHGPIGSGCIVCQTPMEYCTCTDPKDEDPGHGWCGQCGRTATSVSVRDMNRRRNHGPNLSLIHI